MRDNYTLKRLYIDADLSAGSTVALPKDQVHYVATVLRMGEGDSLRLFNGRDGEWRGVIKTLSKRSAEIESVDLLRAPKSMPDVVLAFAPVRRHRTAFIFEKATELGVSHFEPVLTARTQFPKLNVEKAKVQIIEAAEQTERLDIPTVSSPQKLLDWLERQSADPKKTPILFADEAGAAQPALDVIKMSAQSLQPCPKPSVTLLIGPEGGFTQGERDALHAHPAVTPVSLGPRILRADTASLSLLTLWQAVQGDWGHRRG